MFENKQHVSEITMHGTLHLWCPMGSDWYTADVTITALSPETIPDYIDVTKYLDELDGQSLIIEDAAQKVAEYTLSQVGDAYVAVTLDVEDAHHLPVSVTVEV